MARYTHTVLDDLAADLDKLSDPSGKRFIVREEPIMCNTCGCRDKKPAKSTGKKKSAKSKTKGKKK